MPKVDHDLRKLTRVRERFASTADLLTTKEGVIISGKDCAETWRLTQLYFLSPKNAVYRMGNRCIIPRVTLIPKKYKNLLPMEEVGYNAKARLARLKRNYYNEESVQAARDFFATRPINRNASAGITFITGRKRTKPCLQAMTLAYFPGYTNVDVLLRASEVTITLCADFHFIRHVLRRAMPDWMKEFPINVRIHLTMGYIHGQFFPILEQIMPGILLSSQYQLHLSAKKSLQMALDRKYISKWRTELRQHKIFRRKLDEFETNDEGRIVSGPSFFDFEEIDLC